MLMTMMVMTMMTETLHSRLQTHTVIPKHEGCALFLSTVCQRSLRGQSRKIREYYPLSEHSHSISLWKGTSTTLNPADQGPLSLLYNKSNGPFPSAAQVQLDLQAKQQGLRTWRGEPFFMSNQKLEGITELCELGARASESPAWSRCHVWPRVFCTPTRICIPQINPHSVNASFS